MPKVRKVRKKNRTTKKMARKKPRGVSNRLTLPTEDNIPPESLSECVSLIYGRKAIGKTTLANMFDGPLTFMFERGRRNLKIRQVPEMKPGVRKRKLLKWEPFLEYAELFINSDEYQTAIFDSIDRCYLCCLEYHCRAAGVKDPSHLGKDAYGLWGTIESDFNAVMSLFQESGKGMIFLSHEKAEDMGKVPKIMKRETEGSEVEVKIGRWEPPYKPAVKRYLEEVCDYVFYYCFEEAKRCMYVRSFEEFCWCACGLDTFLDPNGNQIEKFEVGNDPYKAYEALLAAHNNELYDLDYEPPRRSKKKHKKK